MPYRWDTSASTDQPVLSLRPHRSLPRRGFAAMVLFAFTMGTLPLYGLLGTAFLWGLLPFILLMVAGLWWGLERSYKDGDILEELTLQDDTLRLSHKPARGQSQQWECNIYWVQVRSHAHGGPVPYYITLTGNGRTVEIGRFLSEEERQTLYPELEAFLRENAAPQR
ncbi:DUF2244 domain-containing protein [Shimia sp. NS0008-38b]|uniref:DUF2244 domain-containing protein n=1 Tax=Shimia sp. NS0008-38b TaxID=3127653 RepID=UPI00333F788C